MDKNQALIKLYSQCLENNFTDMTNEKHQLKAKVFATDLGLKYKKIETLFTEAKAAYEQHQIELERSAQAAKEKADLARKREHLQKNAKLAFTAKGYHYGELKIYRCEDGSVFCKADDEDEKYTNIEITVEAGQLYFYKYHPSKTVYTGASAGGIAMGGFHTTEAHYTQRKTSTEKGSIVIRYGKKTLEIKSITLAPEIAILFKRVPEYKTNFINNTVICRIANKDSDKLLTMSMYAKDKGTQMEIASFAADETKIPFSKCEEIADILNNIIHNKFPVQDEEIYAQATELSKTKDIEHLGEAVKLFEYIRDYKDAGKHLEKIRPVYEELVQKQKEQKIIQKEKKQKKRKLQAIIILLSILVAAVVSFILYTNITSSNAYQNALNALEIGNYTDAISGFSAAGNYKDSREMLKEAQYLDAVYRLENNQDSEITIIRDLAATFSDLGDYKDSEKITNQLLAELELLEVFNKVETILTGVEFQAQKEQNCGLANIEITHDILNEAKNELLKIPGKNNTKDEMLKKIEFAENYANTAWSMVSGDVKVLDYAAHTVEKVIFILQYDREEHEFLITLNVYSSQTSASRTPADIYYLTNTDNELMHNNYSEKTVTEKNGNLLIKEISGEKRVVELTKLK